MAQTVTVIGSFVSPYVRKVLFALELKGQPYEVDPITPFFGNDEFSQLSPLRRIPVLIDGDTVVNDSSIICEYLDDTRPGTPLYPGDPAERAKARWLEEYADSRLGDLCIWSLFYQRCVKPRVWGEQADEDRVRDALTSGLPAALDYLETVLPADDFLFGEVGVADAAIGSFFRNARYAEFEIDSTRWPTAAAFVGRILEHPVMERLLSWETVQLSADIKGRRQALLDAGAPLSDKTWGQREARPGMMAL